MTTNKKSSGTNPPQPQPDPETRHRETIAIGVMTVATILTVILFPVLEILDSINPCTITNASWKKVVNNIVELAPYFTAGTIVLYSSCLWNAIDGIIKRRTGQIDLSNHKHILSLNFLQTIILPVATMALLTIIAKAIAN